MNLISIRNMPASIPKDWKLLFEERTENSFPKQREYCSAKESVPSDVPELVFPLPGTPLLKSAHTTEWKCGIDRDNSFASPARAIREIRPCRHGSRATRRYPRLPEDNRLRGAP